MEQWTCVKCTVTKFIGYKTHFSFSVADNEVSVLKKKKTVNFE